MGQIKRDINTILDLKRGGTNVNFVYRGITLVWQRVVGQLTRWYTTGFSTTVLADDDAGANKWITFGINTKFKS